MALVAGAVLLTRDSSPPPINQAQASKIASDAVKKGIEDLESRPAASATAYQQILPSLVEIETDRQSKEGELSASVPA